MFWNTAPMCKLHLTEPAEIEKNGQIILLNQKVYNVTDEKLMKDNGFFKCHKCKDYFDLANDEVYEIGLTPNRTDAMSHYGVARDLNAYLVSNGFPSDFTKLKSESIEIEGSNDFKLEVARSI